MTRTSLRKQPLFIDGKAIDRACSIYRAINHTFRLQIIGIIHKADTINVTPIIQQLKLEQSLISAHLKILRAAKIVNAEKKGNSVFYSINYQEVNRISKLTERLIPYRTDTSNFLQNADRRLILKTKEDTVTFTPMELRIIHLVCEENTSEEIAEKLAIGRRTVEDHRSNIIKKMKVRNSVGILFFAIKKGLFKI
jgi:DNA-binding CsgD family transcriptional regulator